MKNIGLAFVKNKFVPIEKAAISVMDLAVSRGVGVMEFLRTYNRRPFGMDEHLNRMLLSCRILGLRPIPARILVERAIKRGCAKLRGESEIKIVVTGGFGKHLQFEGRPELIIIFLPFEPQPAAKFKVGAALKTYLFERPLPEAKSTNYLVAAVTNRDAMARGFDDVLYINGKNHISEGTTFNFAIIKGNRLVTPRDGVLNGLTMNETIKLAARAGLSVVRRPIRLPELKTCDEAFITSTVREIMPVVRVDKIRIGKGTPGPYTKILLAKFREEVWRAAGGR
ncbi:hypothetical protein D4R52_01970 [bacterium]|nr:MAG: hypothetical protein D4R52_01970 [bacterium]